MPQPSILDDIIQAAANHGRRSGYGHEIGDLREMLRSAWRLMTPQQRIRFINDDAANRIVCEWRRQSAPVAH